MDRLQVIKARKLYVGDGGAPLPDHAVVFRGAEILDVLPAAKAPQVAGGNEASGIATDILVPGLVDLQLNGAGGRQFNDDPTRDTLDCMAKAAQIGGTAWFLPTFITDAGRSYQRAIAAVEAASPHCIGVIGLHLEGPFLSPARPGIHPPAAIRKIDDADERLITEASVRILLTLAPEETEMARLQRLTASGVRLFAGHSEARYDTIVQAQKSGLRGATHLFNAMSQMANREPGLVGAVFDCPALFAGVIADGIHVHPANLRSALAMAGPERLFLVSDAMMPLGTQMTEFDLLGRRIHRKDGRLMSDAGVLAGADISMIDAVRTLIRLTACDLSTAIQMATQTPARAIGLDHEIGTIEIGKRAGFTLLDQDLNVQSVLYGGSAD
ncbi:N-acetylglucosamine-6-phosphate deacetylase [Marinovum sp. 2_MG-2023]|uniref:N-acetylglucosamine-6-phosphate deacetylase n=1 Tax=unclassified Marinovum TaxID=2647166 RepID=UPI0026E20859|nr:MULTISPECIES: N-acetylglucosamine-6-phosphate deacetylase [unclassified Marinovum]MDO6728959.1 N-acetylglucosamine-6-phosphate deacetylase [Marinovum sp. 2_MG-2023]MDO6779414.1 N-acetylglucosamine-6-phosphate deacetylase [Marinovum sp. 1_MG-2023]